MKSRLPRLGSLALVVVVLALGALSTMAALRGQSASNAAQVDQQQADRYRSAARDVVQEWALAHVYWTEPDSTMRSQADKLDAALDDTVAALAAQSPAAQQGAAHSLLTLTRRFVAVSHSFFRAVDSSSGTSAGSIDSQGLEPLQSDLLRRLDAGAAAQEADASSVLAAGSRQQTALRALLLLLSALGLLLALAIVVASGRRAAPVSQGVAPQDGEELERRVGERTAQLEALNRELQAFAYSVSHDLRAPLNKIAGFTQALLEDYGDRLDADGRDYLVMAVEACRNMSQRMDGLLRLSRLNRAEMTYEVVDVSALAQSVVSELRHAEPERQTEVVIEDGLTVEGDPALLRVALENLLGNAWKFTRYKPSARIEVGSTHQNGHSAIYVRDNGAGFDMAYADKLFGPFQRLHTAREFEGTGIGLATVQRVVHRHGGQVWAEGSEGEGSTFYFTVNGHAEEHQAP